MRRSLLFCLILAPALAQTTQLTYSLVARDILESRLDRVVAKEKERYAVLKGIFEEAGCTGERLTEQPVKRIKLPNVICTLPGETESVIIVGGHFDFVRAGVGVIDNWSGASMLPTLYQTLALTPRRHRFLFIGFTAEEQGLVGSTFYVKSLTGEEARRIRAMVNLDSLGASPTKLWLNGSDRNLSERLFDVAGALKSPISVMNVEQVGLSDSVPFAKRKIPAVDLHSLTQETLPLLHSSRDRLDAVRRDDYYESYRLVAAYLAYLDVTLE